MGYPRQGSNVVFIGAMLKRLALLAAVAMLVGCVQPKAVFPPETVDTATREEYAVYSVVLSQYPVYSWAWDEHDVAGVPGKYAVLCAPVVPTHIFSGTEQIVIVGETAWDDSTWPPMPEEQKYLHLDKGAMADLVSRNRKNEVLKPWFGIKARIVLLKGTEEFWKFRSHNRNVGVITLSRVGFDSGYSNALVQLLWSQGGDMARSFLIILNKKDGKWSVDSKLIAGMA